ncbi:MAG: cobalamin B12-binding domain-containing protein [Spirochaetaceae bacterium]|jgi:radical SAM superfamily enzyme YgiQ (UPF0313 family)|nr:cobalamin B12-binding domain-containing protein [Spirochaetaceae bacterium]
MLNRNIVLVYPKAYEEVKGETINKIPLSLLYLSGAVRDICDEITIFDFNLDGNSIESFESLLSKNAPCVVGINCLFSMVFKDVLYLSEFIKSKFPEIRVVTGGIHPTIYADQIMENCKTIDAIVIGEGDYAFRRLLDYYFSSPPPPECVR